MSEDEFWRCTPRQYDARLKRHIEAIRRADYRAGVVAAILVNVHRNPKKGRAAKPETFFPSLKRGSDN